MKNISEILLSLFSLGWYAKETDFNTKEWNRFCHYKAPELLTIDVKILCGQLIVKLNFNEDKMYSIMPDKIIEFFEEYVSDNTIRSLIYKSIQQKQKLDDLNQDFE